MTETTPVNAYMDPLGISWPVSKLDALLLDADVRATVEAAMIAGRRRRGFSTGAVYVWACQQYHRPIAAGLLLMLVVRRRDLAAVDALLRPSLKSRDENA